MRHQWTRCYHQAWAAPGSCAHVAFQRSRESCFDPAALDWITHDPMFVGGRFWERATIDGLMCQACLKGRDYFQHPYTWERIDLTEPILAAHHVLQMIEETWLELQVLPPPHPAVDATPGTQLQHLLEIPSFPVSLADSEYGFLVMLNILLQAKLDGWENSIGFGKWQKWVKDNIDKWFDCANQGISSRWVMVPYSLFFSIQCNAWIYSTNLTTFLTNVFSLFITASVLQR